MTGQGLNEIILYIFNLVTGITIGEYIRNRRLGLAGRDLLDENNRVIDIAMKY